VARCSVRRDDEAIRGYAKFYHIAQSALHNQRLGYPYTARIAGPRKLQFHSEPFKGNYIVIRKIGLQYLIQGINVTLMSIRPYKQWTRLWWAILQKFGNECYRTWKSEVTSTFAGAIAVALTDYFRAHGQSSLQDALFNGTIGAAMVFILYASVNLLRSVWLEHKSETHGTTMQGIGGALVVLAIIVAFGSGGVLAYWDARSNIALRIPLPDVSQMRELTGCKANLAVLTKPESFGSLRHRTIRLADEILAWEQERYEHHPPYAYADKQNDPDPTPERQKSIDACLKYDRETFDQFNRRFKEQWIEIVRKYELENVKVGTLVNDAEQNHPAQDASLGGQFIPVQMDNGTYFSALSRFRELAYHVDAEGNRIDLH
jgi:hypothetical protein